MSSINSIHGFTKKSLNSHFVGTGFDMVSVKTTSSKPKAMKTLKADRKLTDHDEDVVSE